MARSATRPPWLVIARRELIERVRTKWFLIVTLLGPLAMIGVMVIPALVASQGARERVKVLVFDDSPYHVGEVLPAASAAMANATFEAPAHRPPEAELRQRIARNEIDGYLIIPDDIDDGGTIRYRGDNASNLQFVGLLYSTVSQAVQMSRAESAGLSDEQVGKLFQPIQFEHDLDTGTGKTSSGSASFVVGYVAMFVIYMAIILYAVNVLRSVVQEKTSRVVELVVATTKPRSLMLGKILGVGTTGLIQLTAWAAVALLMMRYRAGLLGLFGLDSGGFDLPEVSLTDVVVILGFFLVGYFFYASIYAAIGAMVSSEQEGQQAQTPVMLMLIVPVLCVQMVANDPRSLASTVLTLIPFSAPVLMPMRYILGGVSTGGLLLSLAVLLASTAIVVVLAARIYRVGILMVGKRPTLGELWRWLRY